MALETRIEKYFHLDIVLTTELDAQPDEVFDKFLQWVEDNGWHCGGGFAQLNEKGEPIINKDWIKELIKKRN